MNKGTVIYVGGFEMPDKNAAAHRVLTNAKALRDIGYKVVFLGISHSESEFISTTQHGFECWSIPYPNSVSEWWKYLTDVAPIKSVTSRYDDIKGIILYNYQACAMSQCMRLCKKNGWFCFGDVTEWYVADHGNILMRLIKNIDTFFRMRILHKKMDGLIVISEFLMKYYEKSVKTVVIPPLVDLEDDKWSITEQRNDKGITLVYAGSPSAQKERLDKIISAVEAVCEMQSLKLIVVGITKEQYEIMYRKQCNCSQIEFWGRVDNYTAISALRQANYSIIIRDNNWVVRAGFPTKFVESISAGTPVIANKFSNITDYIDDQNAIIVENEDIAEAIFRAIKQKCTPNRFLFDYRSWQKSFESILEGK